MAHVFISYAQADSATAEKVAAKLSEVGLSAWYYHRDYIAGIPHLETTKHQIESAALAIVIVSPAAFVSDFVFPEILHAVAIHKTLLPVLVNVTHDELEKKHPRWNAAFGFAASVIWDGGPSLAKIAEGCRHVIPQGPSLPAIVRLSMEELRHSKHEEPDKPGATTSTRTRHFLGSFNQFGDAILCENEVTAFGPAELPAPRRGTSIEALKALEAARFAAASWEKTASLLYVLAGALDVGLSRTKGFYIRVFRWAFVYEGSAGTLLLASVDANSNVEAMIEWPRRPGELEELAPIEPWRVSCFDAVQTVIKQGAIPTGSPPFLRMDDSRGHRIPTWVVSFNGSYMVSALDNTLVFDPFDEAKHSGLLTEFRDDHGTAFECFATTETLSDAFVERFGEMPFRAYRVVRDFRTRMQRSHQFPGWVTYFYFDDPGCLFHGIATGATARDRANDRVLAKARLSKVSDKGISVIEEQYDEHANVVYQGSLFMEPVFGFRKTWSATQGAKRGDYFWFWPT